MGAFGVEYQAKALTKEGRSYSYGSTTHTRHLLHPVSLCAHVCLFELDLVRSNEEQLDAEGAI